MRAANTDVWDTLGTNLQNVTKDITKWHIDDRGQKQKFHGRNTQQREVKHQEHEETLRDISDSNGGELHSINLTPENLGGFLDAHDVAIVDYFAPWCIWCQRLAPTWEKFAAEVKRQHIKLGVGKVDCVAQQQMCKDERVMAFPTLRWVEHGRSVMPDYRGDRTVEALVDYARRRGADRGGGDGGRGRDDDEAALEEWLEEHHPGCQVSGHLMVNRVPGNLHVEARSTHHEIHAAAANLTHRVNHLSFGQPRGPQGHLFDLSWFYDDLPGAYKRTNPMAGKYYPTFHPHFAFHHHMKIVTSHAEGGHFRLAPRGLVLYQILEESQKVQYEEMDVPQVKFLWDMSPMSIRLQREGRRWYEYATNLLAIIGGTYTTLGLINATLLRIFKPKKF